MMLPYRIKSIFLRQRVTYFEGLERSSGEKITMLVGGDQGLCDYLKSIVFSEALIERRLADLPIWLPPLIVSRIYKYADILIWHRPVNLERFPKPKVLARVPTWTELEIDLLNSDSVNKAKKKLRTGKTLFSDKSFEIGISQSVNCFTNFYDNLYIPYILKQHGENASIEHREEMMMALEKGNRSLIEIKQNGTSIAGMTVNFDGMESCLGKTPRHLLRYCG